MRSARQALGGFLLAALSFIIVLGSVSLSLAEGGSLPAAAATTSLPPTLPAPPTVPGNNQPALSASPTAAPSASLPPPTNCPPPAGWIPVVVAPGQTLESIAAAHSGLSAQELALQNCLLSAELVPGAIIYVPGSPTPVPTICRPPAGYIQYIVQPGDTLYHIAWLFSSSVEELQQANCMGSSFFLRSGQVLYVPNRPTRTASPTVTLPPSATPTVTHTGTVTSTATPAPSETPSATATPAASPTATTGATP